MVAGGPFRLLCSAGCCPLPRSMTYVALSCWGYFRGTWQLLQPGLSNLRAHCLSQRDTWWEAKMVICITDEMISWRCSWFSLETCGKLGSNRKDLCVCVCVIWGLLLKPPLTLAVGKGSWEGKLENTNCVVHSQVETKVAIACFPQRLGCSLVLVSLWISSVLQGQCRKSAGGSDFRILWMSV